MKIIGFSGPPRSGKDTIAKELALAIHASEYQFGHADPTPKVKIDSLSMPMRKMAFALLDIPYSEAMYESMKDTQFAIFDYKTLREFMIDLSERFMKPRYGHGVWGLALLWKPSNQNVDFLIVPDVGFKVEVDLFWAFANEYLPINVYRNGFDWDNDSRSHHPADTKGLLAVTNNDPKQCAQFILRHMQTLGWVA